MEPLTDPPSLFALAIFRINGLLMRNGERITKEVGQSSARWQVLGRVGFGTQTVAQMAREMGMARQSVQRVADVLAAEGLTEYQVHPEDQRTKLVAITPTGLLVLAAIYQRNSEWSQRIQTRLAPEEFWGVLEPLERIARVLEEDI